MSVHKILEQLGSPLWAIDPNIVGKYFPLIAALLTGSPMPDQDLAAEREARKPKTFIATSATSLNLTASSGRVAPVQSSQRQVRLITIDTAITKYGGYCSYGTMEMAEWVREAAADPKIAAIWFDLDSPGGMVDGCQTLIDAILDAKQVKPVFAFINDGMACSAAYHIASACTEIWASKRTDIIGSIGVMISYRDYTEYYKKLGIEDVSIYATQSADKNGPSRAAKEGNFKPIQEELLDPHAAAFISNVKSFRDGKLQTGKGKEDPFTGKTYTAERAQEIGLIDNIGPKQAAIDRLNELIDSFEDGVSALDSSKTTDKTMKYAPIKAGFLKFMALIGLSTINASEDGNSIMLSEEEVNKMNIRIEQAEKATAEAEGKIKLAEDAKAAAEKASSDLKAENDQLKNRISMMQGAPKKEGNDATAMDNTDTYNY